MSLIKVISGTLLQVTLGAFIGLASVFIGGGIANQRPLTTMQDTILTSAIFVIPGSFALSALIVWGYYFSKPSATGYLWYLAPWVVVCFYAFYCVVF